MSSNHELIQTARRLALLATVITPFLAPSPATADSRSFCGMRFDFGRTPRLTVFGLTSDQRLVKFEECNPRRLRKVGAVSGLQDDDTVLVGIDFRVQDRELYGLGDGGGIYTIDTRTAEAFKVTELTVDLQGGAFGVDFNPAANALRIISDTGQNLRHPFAGPLLFQTQIDMPLNYTPGTNATGVTGAAYTNNDLDAATSTTLFDIDTNLDQVAIQSPPNNGSLVATGLLNVDADATVGFDIYTRLREGVAVANNAFATLVVAGRTGFYRVNQLAGTAILIDNFSRDKTDDFSDPVIDIAIPLKQ
ncbi:MAG: DUF4394 domain-containing protein [Geminicoccaceae bacterium]